MVELQPRLQPWCLAILYCLPTCRHAVPQKTHPIYVCLAGQQLKNCYSAGKHLSSQPEFISSNISSYKPARFCVQCSRKYAIKPPVPSFLYKWLSYQSLGILAVMSILSIILRLQIKQEKSSPNHKAHLKYGQVWRFRYYHHNKRDGVKGWAQDRYRVLY